MPDILVVGSLNTDLVVRAPRFPQPGETISGEDLQVIPGGKGANQAVAAARLGSSVSMLGRVGKDNFGDLLLDNLRSNHVDSQLVQRDDQPAPPSSSWIQMDRIVLSYPRVQMEKSLRRISLPFWTISCSCSNLRSHLRQF
jgi:ribokinase